jgi:uncharacterized membrane protein
MKIDVRQLERPMRIVTDRSGDEREDGMSIEMRELVLSFGRTASTDDSESLVEEYEDPETSLSE